MADVKLSTEMKIIKGNMDNIVITLKEGKFELDDLQMIKNFGNKLVEITDKTIKTIQSRAGN